MKQFYCPDISDKRLYFACTELSSLGYKKVDDVFAADFVVLGINPSICELGEDIPIFAGNVSGNNVFDYTKDESFALSNAYLTAEAAMAEMITNSESSLINSRILITGYGRIAKALHKYLSQFTTDITVCARSTEQRQLAVLNGAKAIDISQLVTTDGFDYLLNTIPHPIINKKELEALNVGCTIFDLASFPGGVDKHFARQKGISLYVSRGLPGKYSPSAAGRIIAHSIDRMITEGKVIV